MKPKTKRLYVLILGLCAFGIGFFFILKAIESRVVFFYSPTDLFDLQDVPDKKIRLGGMVVKNSIKYIDDELRIRFTITDYKNSINVYFKGIPPDLFREGQGIIAEGKYQKNKDFVADRILAKHDENYMPREVKESLKIENESRKK